MLMPELIQHVVPEAIEDVMQQWIEDGKPEVSMEKQPIDSGCQFQRLQQ